MPQFTTQDYAQLSQNAYDIQSNKNYTQPGDNYLLEHSENRYFVLDRKNDLSNGFQGMIVAPAMQKDGKTVPDKSHIAVVYAGTTFDWHNRPGESFNDVSQDVLLFGTGANKGTTLPPPPPAPPTGTSTAAVNAAIANKANNNQAKDADALAKRH